MFGCLIGGLLATSVVPRVQWLNLATMGTWVRPVVCAVAAGLMVGAVRRDGGRAAAIAGGLAALVSLWGVYGIVRLGVRVLFVERSVVLVVAADLLRLAAYAIPAGAVGAFVAASARARLWGRSSRATSR